MANSILFSNVEYDVHPYEWVSALLSDYKTLREVSKIKSDDPDAEDMMLSEVSALVKKAHEIRMKKEHEQLIIETSMAVVEDNPFKL